MGLLWPGLMGRFGDVFGLPFVIEGIFFFLEAILIAIYVYGWDRLEPRVHYWLGLPLPLVSFGGACSILAANSWMNTPQGFELDRQGNVTNVDVFKAIFTPAWWYETLHFVLAALLCAGFVVASVYAVGMLRGRRDRYHRLGFLIPFTIAAIATPVQMLVGDQVMRQVIDDQPVKFAAIELVPETARDVPEVLFGRLEDGEVVGGIEIPGLASFLSGFSTDTEIKGLNIVPEEDRPPATIVHWAFDIMVLAATALMGLVVWFAFVWWRRRDVPRSRWFLRAAAVAGILAMAAMEAGWVTTEVGRQPWIVYGHLRTADAVSAAPGLRLGLYALLVVYTILTAATIYVLRLMARAPLPVAPQEPEPVEPRAVP
jgi:cytochrome bd ubiquinol oxidase subunit I